jgi:protein SSD1
METLLVKTMSRAKYVVAGRTRSDQLPHFSLNLPVYTHFTNPSRRYADIIVHRQLEAALSGGAIEFTEDVESLVKTAEQCNTKKDSAQSAHEQSVHIESCRIMDKKRKDLGTDLISEGIVICVYESAFDVLIPEYGFEKRVHCDQLPLKKAEFRKETRVLELYWEKGVTSTAYIPEDERPAKGGRNQSNGRYNHQGAIEKEEQPRKQIETGTMSTDDVDALFDDDDDEASGITEMTAGVSLGPPSSAERPTQSMPQTPTRTSPASELQRTQSDPKFAVGGSENSGTQLSDKDRYLKMFKLREEGGEYIQDVTEMTRVPVILKTDLTKSPP